jgi:hypothetical protein
MPTLEEGGEAVVAASVSISPYNEPDQWDNATASLQSTTFGSLYTPLTGRSRKTPLGVKINF